MNASGKRARIPTVINNEIPLPIPLSVILSPNQTANIEPAINTSIVCVHQKVEASTGIAPLDCTYNVK